MNTYCMGCIHSVIRKTKYGEYQRCNLSKSSRIIDAIENCKINNKKQLIK